MTGGGAMGAEVWAAVAAEVFAPVALALAGALGAWIASKLPGPVRDFLQSNVHARDVALIGQAMLNRALASKAGGAPTAVAATDLESYARAVLPEVLQKVKPTEDALRTLALAALQRAAAEVSRPVATRPAGPLPG